MDGFASRQFQKEQKVAAFLLHSFAELDQHLFWVGDCFCVHPFFKLFSYRLISKQSENYSYGLNTSETSASYFAEENILLICCRTN